jgi:predicted neuraminidase
VRGGPFQWADGSIGIPAYHELLGKFGELLRLSQDGQILDKERLSRGRSAIQPVIVPLDERNALALLRNCGDPPRALLQQRTDDGGARWSSPEPLHLPNPNASVAALRLRGGSILLAYNHPPTARRNLWLALSKDNGQTWVQWRAIEEAPAASAGEKVEFSYPDLGQTSDGTVHLVYTWNRTHIKHVAFNESWLNHR